MAITDNAVWVAQDDGDTVTRIDPATNMVAASITIGSSITAIRALNGSIWAVSHDEAIVYQIDPSTNRVAGTVAFSPPIGFLGTSPDALWVVSSGNAILYRLDPTTKKTIATISLFSATEGGPINPVFAAGSVWVCDHDPGTKPGLLPKSLFELTRIDPSTNKVLTDVGLSSKDPYRCSGAVAVAGGVVWTGLIDKEGNNDIGVARIDPATETTTEVMLPAITGAYYLAGTDTDLWVLGPDGIVRIDPATGSTAPFLSQANGAGLAVGDGALWVGVPITSTVLRVTLPH